MAGWSRPAERVKMPDFSVTTLHEDAAELGEGPSYDPERDTLWWFDIIGRRLYEHRFAEANTRSHPLPRMASMLVRIDPARQLLAMTDGLYIREIATGKLTLDQPLEADNAATRSNDGRTHPSGALWIGTMGRNAEKKAGAIYWYDGRRVEKIFDRITIPNAIAFSPDGTTGYFTDSDTGLLMQVALDAATGLPNGEPRIFYDNRKQRGAFDGAVTDRDGLLWNARWGAAAIDAYTPAGERIKTIKMPAKQVTCPAFCGAGGEKMAVTSAFEHLSPARRRLDPMAGATFLITDGFKGRFDPPFQPRGTG